MEQKFERGNKVMDGKKEAIIVGSYADKYGGSNRKDYTIMFCETGSTMSWMHESQLQFVEDGGEFLFEQAKVNHDRILKQNLDIDFIKENLNGGLSSDSILFLFDMIGFKSAFLRNGEYYVLMVDWQILKPVFQHIKNAETIKDAESIITGDGLKVLDVKKVFDAFHSN